MKNRVYPIIALAIAASFWLFTQNRPSSFLTRVSPAASENAKTARPSNHDAITASRLDKPRPLREQEPPGEDPWRHYLEENPRRASGARGRNAVRFADARTEVHQYPIPTELEFLGELPPDPNMDRIIEVHDLRSELSGAIHEDSRQRWDQLLTAAEDSGNKTLMMTVLTNVSPSALLQPDEAAVLTALEAGNIDSTHHSRQVAHYIKERRAKAVDQLAQSNADDPEWLTTHVNWLEEAARTLHYSLDPQSDGLSTDWQAFTDELFPDFHEQFDANRAPRPHIRNREGRPDP